MSLILSRPFIINTNYYTFELPNLQLESIDTPEGLPSPITNIALQCQLGKAISQIPEVMGGVVTSAQAGAIQRETEKWMASFPPTYSITDPDTQYDRDYHYVTFQRYQLHAIGYMTILAPFKLSLTKDANLDMSDADREIRQTAVQCALKLMDIARQLLEFLLPVNAKFFLATFLIFDTAAYLCSAITHDTTRTLPQREKVIETIASALNMLEHVRSTKLGATCYAILRKVMSYLPQDVRDTLLHDSTSPESSIEGPRTPPVAQQHPDPSSAGHIPDANSVSAPSIPDAGLPTTMGMGFSDAETVMPQLTSLDDLSNMDLGSLSQIWDWGYLGLDP